MRPIFEFTWDALCIVASILAISCYLAGFEQIPGAVQRVIYLAVLVLAPLPYIVQCLRSGLTKGARLLLRWAVPITLVIYWIILPPCWLLTLAVFQDRLNSNDMFVRLEKGSSASSAAAAVDADALPVITAFPMWRARCMEVVQEWLVRQWSVHERTTDFRIALEELHKFESYQESELIRQAFDGLPKLKIAVLEERQVLSELERMRLSIAESISEDNVDLVRSQLAELDDFQFKHQDFQAVKKWYDQHRPAIDYYLKTMTVTAPK